MSRGSRKITVIGAGNVGATCAFVLANMKIADIVLLDIYEGFAKGKALDMSQNANVLNYNGTITGTSSYEDITDSDVVVVTSGFPRQPGMTREDLIGKNAEIIAQVGAGIRDHAPDAVVIVVTNPLDLMTYHMQKVTGFPSNRVIGQAGVLDSARMAHFIALELGCAEEDVLALWFLAGTGTPWCLFPRFTTVGGIADHSSASSPERPSMRSLLAHSMQVVAKLSSSSSVVLRSMPQGLLQQSWQKLCSTTARRLIACIMLISPDSMDSMKYTSAFHAC